MIPKAKILEHKGRAVGARSERRRRPRERERGASAHARRGRGIRPLCSPLRPAPGAVSGLPAVALPRICHLSPAAAHACQLVPLRRASSVVHSFWRVRSCAPDRIVPSSTETAPYRASTTHRAHAKRHFRLRFYDMWRRFVSVSLRQPCAAHLSAGRARRERDSGTARPGPPVWPILAIVTAAIPEAIPGSLVCRPTVGEWTQ